MVRHGLRQVDSLLSSNFPSLNLTCRARTHEATSWSPALGPAGTETADGEAEGAHWLFHLPDIGL